MGDRKMILTRRKRIGSGSHLAGGLARRVDHPLGGRARRLSGFTLLEVLLSLLLAAFLLVALAAVVDFQLRVVDAGRTRVEEAQLARSLLGRIADDLRGAVLYDPQDVEKLVPGMIAAGVSGQLGSLAEQAGVDAGTDESADGGADESGDSPSTDPLQSTLPRQVPGVYGGPDWLQVDVSRLPRPEEYSTAVAAANLGGDMTAGGGMGFGDGALAPMQRPSDVKSVAYFLAPPQAGPGLQEGAAESQGGLVRREMDRAVTAWANEQGALEESDRQLAPIAPEVAAIQFLYFDGSQWTDSWDSSAQGGLPVAVEVTLSLESPRHASGWFSSWAGTGPSQSDDQATPRDYRLLVYLPAAQPAGSETSSEAGEAQSESPGGSEQGDQSGADAEGDQSDGSQTGADGSRQPGAGGADSGRRGGDNRRRGGRGDGSGGPGDDDSRPARPGGDNDDGGRPERGGPRFGRPGGDRSGSDRPASGRPASGRPASGRPRGGSRGSGRGSR